MQGNIHVPPHATLSSCVYNISIAAAAAAIAVAAVVLRLQQKGCTVNSIRFRKWHKTKKKTRNNTKHSRNEIEPSIAVRNWEC